MKLSVLLLASVLLFSCSKQENSSSLKVEKSPEKLVELFAGEEEVMNVDFGRLEKDKSGLITVKITNTSGEVMVGNLVNNKFELQEGSDSGFSIPSQSGCASIKNKGSCTIKVSFNSKGKAPNELFEGSIVFNENLTILLSASSYEGDNEEVELVSSDSSVIDFGDMIGKQAITKNINYKNISGQVLPAIYEVSLPAPFKVTDMCSNKTIAKNGTCQIKISLNANGLPGGVINEVLSFAGLEIPVSANIIVPQDLPPEEQPQPNLVFIYQNQESSNLDLGTFTPDTIPSLITINVKNKGEGLSSNIQESMAGTGLTIVHSTCNKTLKKNETCTMKCSLRKDIGTYLSNISQENQTLSLGFNVVLTLAPPVCSLENMGESSIDNSNGQVAGVSGDIPFCLVSACNLGYQTSIDELSCEAKSCSSLTPSEQDFFDYNLDNASLVGSFPNCSISCDQGFFQDGNSCLPNVITYQPSYSDYGSCSASQACDGIGEQVRTISSCQKLENGLPVAGGQISDCDSFAVAENLSQSCSSPAGESIVPIDNGEKTVSCETGSSTGSFVSLTCNQDYSPEGEICLADVITYSPVYSEYGSCSVSQPCDGMGSQSRTINDCLLVRNGVEESSVAVSNCSAFAISENLINSCASPAGNIVVNITGGSKTVYCEAGSSSQQTQSVSCTGDYVEKNGACSIPMLSVNLAKGFNGVISKAFPLDDGSVIYTGNFTAFVDKNGVSHTANGISKINPDGSLNLDFQANIGAGFNGAIWDGVLDSTKNHIFLVGAFTQFKGVSRGRIAKIGVDGVINATFNTNTGTACQSNCQPYNIDRDSNNNIYVSGSFQYFNGGYLLTPITNYAVVMKFSPDGVRDTAFQSTVGVVSEAETVATTTFVNKNNNHLIMTYCSASGVCGLLKFSTAGVRDATFKTNVGTFVGGGVPFRIVFDESNNIYVLGNITTAKNGVTARYVVKYSATGVFNTAFNNAMVALNMDYYPRTLAFDGTYLYISGSISTVAGGVTKRLLRIDTNGVWDSTFNQTTGTNDANFVTFNPYATDITFDNNGNIYLVGSFNFFNGKSANYQVKLSPSGETINFIQSGAELNGTVWSMVKDSAGNIYLGGQFSCYGMTPCTYGMKAGGIIKFNPDLSINIDFLKNIGNGTNYYVYTMDIDANDNLYIGGNFTQVGSVANNAIGMAKISPNGILNTAFSNAMDVSPGVKNASTSGFQGGNKRINSILVDNVNNAVYVGGDFTTYKNQFNNARNIAKLSLGGVLDTTFSNNLDVNPGTKATTSGFNNTVNTLALDNFGNLFVGGNFTSFKGVGNAAKYLAKLSSDGVLDSSFQSNYGNTGTTGLNSQIRAIAFDSENNIYIGGDFNGYNNVNFSASRIAKFNSSGIIDTDFMNNLDVIPGTKTVNSGFGGSVYGLIVDNNDLYVSGNFSTFKGVAGSAPRLAKLDTDGNFDSSFQLNLGTGLSHTPYTMKMYDDLLYYGGPFSTYQGLTNKYFLMLTPDGLQP